MDRKIKFRGMSTDNGEWIYGFYCAHIDPSKVENEFNIHSIYEGIKIRPMVNVNSETIGQFTGIYDKNEKEIYEGDILNVFNNKMQEYEQGEVVMSGLGCWSLCIKQYNLNVPIFEFMDNNLSLVHSTNKIEIIGNIHCQASPNLSSANLT